MKKLVVLSGAGMSAESGISTFRDAGGLWEGHDIMEVASPEGWSKNPEVVLNFYNLRRRQLKEVHPNKGHLILKDLEKYFDVQIITQNVDNLHERAGSSNIIHLHGELNKVRSINDENYILDWTEDLHWGDTDTQGHQMRPHIVWFGEAVPAIELAANLVSNADIIVIIGTSMQVYPAAGLIDYAPDYAKFFYIDPQPAQLLYFNHTLTIIPKIASEGCQDLKEILISIS
ncbi:MAG: SIR2 family NAD-dependent protein deacylase [Flavobacterium sp.]